MKVLDQSFKFSTALKVNPTEGNLVYEYNPFFNYRLDRTMAYYKNRLWELEQLAKELNISYDKQTGTFNITSWEEVIPKTETPPVIYQKGQLVDFETDELNFSLNNPVNILPQYSYDNSVNLIINDGLNPPRLINSRFSATEKNKYQICDRKGNNDSNIYDQGDQFDVDTSLYKKITNIPELQFSGVGYGGNLKIGNYHFYFRYVDNDGNMSDFFAESGLVSIFIGNAADSIRSGFREENSHKLVKFIISNTDPSYQEILIYYTKATSDIYQNATVGAYKIDRKYKLSDSGNTLITITGFEEVDEVDISEINPMYQIYGSSETQEQCQNILFLANVDRPRIPYEDLKDCALRFLPYVDTKSTYPVEQIGEDYSGNISGTYYDASYIYKKVGYHCDEIYRLGIVFILSDNTLSEVFNVRGTADLSNNVDGYSEIAFYKESNGERVRNYINFDEQYYNIVTESGTISKLLLENAKGVIKTSNYPFNTVLGLNFKVSGVVLDYLYNTLKVKGFFFVRQKRIPTTLCQAYTIGIDNQSHTPVIPSNNTFLTESFLTKYNENSKGKENSESRILTNERKNRMRELQSYEISDISIGAICPEYDVNSPYLNTLFNGSDFRFKEQQTGLDLKNEDEGRHFICTIPTEQGSNTTTNSKVIGVEDNVKLVAINNAMFSARAGEAEEAFRYEYIGQEKISKKSDNLLRGSYGPYLGITGYNQVKSLINIKIPGYSESNLQEYFEIRFHDKSQFYPISYRMDLSKLSKWLKKDGADYTLKESLYRGDCYICQFTHRINRNFQDPSSPTNDTIVDQNCWKNNYDVSDGVVKKENFEKINLGDVNAIRLGMYITLYVRSTINLNVRAQDDSNSDEIGLFGHPRSFYPQHSMSNSGAYKIPEALCYNKGFEKSLSEKIFFEVPDVPWIKNEFSNRIAYSEIQVSDAFENGWRTFLGTNYRDYPKTYGSIVKLIELKGNLVCVFEHGIALIPVNERVVAGNGNGGNVYINTSNVLPENPKIISDIYGSQWRESIIKSPQGYIYGVDTVAKKIWRTDGQTFECISDFKVQEFLNQNISLGERELDPIIGIRNIKTHYNKFKHDVMFTFYDNLYGFEEKVWNLCYNELKQKWVTFYSWVPSYSENIYNQYFSFDRNTSKWITKLGISNAGNDFSDGVCLSDNIIPNNAESSYQIGTLSLANRTLPEGEGISVFTYYTLDRDSLGNFNYFDIKYQKYQIVDNKKSYIGDYVTLEDMLQDSDKNYDSILVLKTDSVNLCSELYVRGSNREISTLETIIAKEGKWKKLSNGSYRIYEDDKQSKYTDYDPNTHKCVEKKTTLEVTLNFYSWLNNCVINSNYPIYKDDRGRRIQLSTIDKDRRLNGNKIVTLLNIKANILVTYDKKTPSLAEAYTSSFKNGTQVNAGYYQSVVAVMPQYNMQFLTTDFWKHGQSGIIDIADKINPAYWYGKQHPFEFEFIVADNPQLHKIFDNLEIISNSAEPESFHYEIVGDCYEFAKDKKNMYIRQEATKELYQYNGSDILFDSDYVKLDSEHRKRYMIQNGARIELQGYDKSTLFPLYYCRRNDFNNIEDYYHLKDGTSQSKDFSALSGAEIVRYDNLQEYRICNHAKAINIADDTKGRIRGNMQYKEDKWCVQINPINLIQKNEPTWVDLDNQETDKVPVELNQNPLPDDILSPNKIEVPPSFEASGDSRGRGYTQWGWNESQNKEVKIKDKWVKIRVRYKGDKLAIITAIRTLYSASYA